MISRRCVAFCRLLSGVGLAALLGLQFGAPSAAYAQDRTETGTFSPSAQDALTPQENEPAWKTEWRKQWLAEHPKEAKKALAKAARAKEEAAKAKAAKTEEEAAKSAPTAKSTTSPAPTTASASTSTAASTPIAAESAPKKEATTPAVAGTNAKVAPSTPTTKAPATPPVDPAFSETKPDGPGANVSTARPADKTLDSPLTTVGDAWKMLLYLVPTLLVIVGILAGLRRFQERNGRLPGLLQATARRQAGRNTAAAGGGWISALVAGMQQNRARQRGGSSIRLVESVPMGGSYLHLVEVRGRLLLLGASGSGLALLTEFTDPKDLQNDDFRALLQAAAVDLETLDVDTSELPPAALVGSLEEELRDTNASLARRARRLRTVQEEEDAYLERGNEERRR